MFVTMEGAAASLLIFISFALNLRAVDSGYLITVPRRWVHNEATQICVSLTDASKFAAGDSLDAVISVHAFLRSKYLEPRVISKNVLQFTSGESNQCVNMAIPEKTVSELGSYSQETSLDLKGILAGNQISETVNVTIVDSVYRIFVQTDKYLYKPGQIVEFRVLSVAGPFLNVQTDNLESVYVENPSKTRIQQWLNVTNQQGLVHLKFQLSDEVEEGSYRIIVKTESSENSKYFKVEDYVLPKYEITIKSPSVVFGNDKTVTLEMCAKYTYGEDVKGNATMSVAVGSWRIYANETQSKPISGCTNFTFDTSKLRFDDNNCHIRVSNLKVRGVVVEEGTEVELAGENNDIKVVRKVMKFNDESPPIIKKSYMPRFFKIATTYADGTNAKNELMEVCTYYLFENVCKNFTTSNNGYLTFTAPTDAQSRFTVTAVNHPKIVRNWNDVMSENKFHQYSYDKQTYVDPSNSSLTIYDKSELNCTNGNNHVIATIPVIYFVRNVKSADVFVQVLSRGQVQKLNKIRVNFTAGDLPYKNFDIFIESPPIPADVTKGAFNIDLDLPATVSPKIQLLVWFTTPEGIVVADTVEIDVTRCLPHKVSMDWSVPKAEPGSKVDISITGAKNSLCSIGVVDKSVELLSNKNNHYLSMNDVLSNIYSYEFRRWDKNQINLEYCLSKYNGSLDVANRHLSAVAEKEKLIYEQEHTFRRSGNSRKEAIDMFVNAGYYVLTDQTVQRQFCYNAIINAIKEEERRKEEELNRPPPLADQQNRQPVSSLKVRPVGGAQQFQAHASPPQIANRNQFSRPQQDRESISVAEVSQQGEQERSYLPETWLWNLVPLSDTGLYSKSLTIPDTITEWVGRTVCVHPSEGVGISDPSPVVTFTPFFTDLTLPATIKREEILPLKVSVFNYLDEDLPVKLILKQSSEYETVEGDLNVRDICVPAKDKFVETIKIKFIELGDVNITVEATVDHNSALTCGTGIPSISKTDRLIRSLPVEAEGIVRQKTWTKYICAEDIADVAVPAEAWTIAAPLHIVQGSDRAWVTATGDLMGPTLENIGRIVDQPSGCGEQNMVNFAPNVYTRQYLKASNQLNKQIEDKIDFYLRRGYQRQLRYRHSSDGSFSSFGPRDTSGSTWLTAFVLKSLNQARPFTYIDEKVLLTAAKYLYKKQNNVTGCFESEGRVIHKMLQGGLDVTGKENNLLSAYVLATLGTLGPDLDIIKSSKELFESTSQGSVKPIFPPPDRYLPNSEVISLGISCIENDQSNHPYSLALKAYSLAVNRAPSTLGVIKQLLNSAVVTVSEMSWDLPLSEKNSALQVETAGYALLALVTYDAQTYVDECRKIVRWISGNRNSRGGFVSTQDTVVALEALAAFQKVQPSVQRDLNATIKSGNFKHQFNILENNKLLEQRVDLPTVPADVKIFVDGKGCGIVQGVIRYNVLAESPSDAFVLNVKATELGKNCRSRRISACSSYTLSDKISNMAIFEFKLQTGFTVDKQHLREVLDADKSGNLKRFEVDGSKVTFYLEELRAEETCVAFNVYQEVYIQNIKEGYVKVYDYYQPEYETTKNYRFPDPILCNAV